MLRAHDWASFVKAARPDFGWTGRLLTLDPGETTGWSLWQGSELIECGQWPTLSPDILAEAVRAACLRDSDDRVNRIVYEEYRIRGNKAREHVGSEVVTIQHIGAVKVVAAQLDITVSKQTAGMAKGFVTDAKLRRWGLYQVGRRHANDAIRHAVYWLLFAAGRKLPRRVTGDTHGNDARSEGNRSIPEVRNEG